MVTTIEIYEPEQKRDYTTEGINSIAVECWENDAMSIRDNNRPINGEHEFRFEISKEDAIKLAKMILTVYEK
jgi:hypothetical protein